MHPIDNYESSQSLRLKKLAQWNFRAEGQAQEKQIETIEQFIEETQNFRNKFIFDEPILCFIVDEGRYWAFNEENCDKFFKSQLQTLQVQMFYKSKKKEQQVRIRELLRKSKMLENQLQSRLDNEAQTLLSYLRIASRRSTHEESQFKKTVKLCLFLSQPLLSENKEPLYRQQLDLQKYQQILADSFMQSINIDLNIQKFYLSNWHLKKMLLQHKNVRYDALVLQLFTSIHEQNDILYLSSEDDEHIGLRSKIKLKDFMKSVKQIKNIYCIIFVGLGMRILKTKQKQIRQKFEIPIIAINTFNIQEDSGAKQFLKIFYSDMFKRKSLQSCFENAEKMVVNSKQFNLNCCCLHDHQKNNRWNNFVKIVGYSTAHKMLGHLSYLDMYQKWKSSEPKQIVKIITDKSTEKLEIFMAQIQPHTQPFECYETNDNFKIHHSKRSDFVIIKAQKSLLDHSYLYYPPEEEQFLKNKRGRKGELQTKSHNIERPKIIYEIIKELRKQKNMVVCVVGEARSGKYNSICLAENYINQRSTIDYEHLSHQKIIFQSFVEDFQTFNITQLLQKIEQLLKAQSNRTRLILKINKISLNQHQKLEQLIQQIKKNIMQQHVYIFKTVCFLVSSSVYVSSPDCKQIEIPKLTKNQIKYIIFRQFGNKFLGSKNSLIGENLPILSMIIQKTSIFDKIPFLDLSQFIKNLNFGAKKPNIKQIEEAIQNYLKRTQIVLHQIKRKIPNFWHFLGFLCQFQEGFIVSPFNEELLSNLFHMDDLIEKINLYAIQARQKSIPVFDVSQLGSEASSQKKSNWKLFIRPENIMNNYFINPENEKSKQRQFLRSKIEYFWQFFSSVISILKEIQQKFDQNNKKLSKEGLFLFQIKPKQQVFKGPTNYSFRQRKLLFKDLFRHHQQSFYLLLKVIRQNSGEDSQWSFLKQQYEVRLLFLCSILDFLKIQKITLLFLSPNSLHNIQSADTSNTLSSRELFYDRIQEIIMLFNVRPSLTEIILISQIIAIIRASRLDQKIFQLNNSQAKSGQQKIVKNMILYERNCFQINQKKFFLHNITQKPLHKREKQTNDEKKEIIDHLSHLIRKSINLIKDSLLIVKQIKASALINDNFKDRLNLMHLKMIIKKIIIKFQNNIKASNQDRHHQFSHQQLQEELKKNKKQCSISYLASKELLLCETYLKLNTGPINEVVELKFNQNEVDPEALQLYKEIAYKVNPKSLLERKNIFLFMKSRCLNVNKKQCCFVRKGNIIKSFFKTRLQDKDINLFFLNLSYRNFQTISNGSIEFFVLSVDTQEEGQSLKLLFENSYSAEEDAVQYSKFLKIMQSISFRYLIIFGSLSDKLAERLKKDLNIQMPIIIFAFSLNSKLSLSTSPERQQKKNVYSSFLTQTVSKFLSIENDHRMMELVICGLVTFLSRQKNSVITYNRLLQVKQRAIGLGKQILKKWYRQKKIDIDGRIQSSLHISQQFENQNLFFRQIASGKLNDITSSINAIPHNLNDEKFYELVGRVKPISEAINFLIKQKKCLIQISGKKKTGKTEFLKQIGWFCQTRHSFGLGVYYFDLDKVRKSDNSIMDYLFIHKEESLILKLERSNSYYESGKNYLLLLLDNLNLKDIKDNEDFFQIISHRPIALIYSAKQSLKQTFYKETKMKFEEPSQHIHTSSEDKKIKHHHSINMNAESPLRRQYSHHHSPNKGLNLTVPTLIPPNIRRKSTQKDETRPWRWKNICLNNFQQRELIGIALTRIRNRTSQSYEDILKNILGDETSSISDDQPSPESDNNISELEKVLQKIEQYQKKMNCRTITRNYLKYDVQKLLKMTDTVDKIYVRIRR